MGLAQKSAILVAALAAVYQFWFKGFVFDVLGVGRTVQRLEEFPWSCRRIKHSQFEGCEDLYLDENDRVLYAACSGSITRGSWNPGWVFRREDSNTESFKETAYVMTRLYLHELNLI